MILSPKEFLTLRSSEDPELYSRAANDSAPIEVWLGIIQDYPEMRMWVAQNKTVPHIVLEKLSTDQDPTVRAMVARKRKLELSLIERLAMDPDESVRLAIAHNPKTPYSVLEILSNDVWNEIVRVAQRRLSSI